MSPRHWLMTSLGLLLTYGIVLVGSAVILLSIMLAESASGGSGFGGMAEDLDANPVLMFMSFLFQLAGTILLGTMNFTIRPDGGGPFAGAEATVSAWGPNLLILLLAIWLGKLLLRRMLRGPRIRPAEQLHLGARLIIILVTSALMALLVFLLSLATALRYSEEGIRLTISSAGVALFFGAWLVFALVAWLGLGVTSRERAALARVSQVIPNLGITHRVALLHVALVGLPLTILFSILLASDGSAEGILALPLWGPLALSVTLVWASFGTAYLGSTMNAAIDPGGGMAGGESGHYYIFNSDLDVWFIVLTPVIGVIGIVATAFIWAAARNRSPQVLRSPLSWLPLPLAYLIFGALLTLFARLSVNAQAGGPQFPGGTIDFSVGPSWWTFAWFLLIGLIIEGLSRVFVPAAGRAVPGFLVKMAGGHPAQQPVPAYYGAHQNAPHGNPAPYAPPHQSGANISGGQTQGHGFPSQPHPYHPGTPPQVPYQGEPQASPAPQASPHPAPPEPVAPQQAPPQGSQIPQAHNPPPPPAPPQEPQHQRPDTPGQQPQSREPEPLEPQTPKSQSQESAPQAEPHQLQQETPPDAPEEGKPQQWQWRPYGD